MEVDSVKSARGNGEGGRKHLLGEKTVCLATFAVRWKGKLVGRTIYPAEVFEYLKPRAGRLYYIEQPMNAAADRTPTMEVYERGDLKARYRLSIPKPLLAPPGDLGKTSLRLKFRDVAAIVVFLLRTQARVDLFIAMEGVNALAGALLKKVGVVHKVAYCVMDYMPRRFQNAVLNAVFHAIDRACMRFCDYAWNVTPNVELGRRHYDGFRKGARQLIVPVPSPRPDSRLLSMERDGVVYLGLLYPNLGVDILVRAFKKVVLQLPWAKLRVVGEGPLRSSVEEFVRSNKLQDSVTVYGMLDNEDADKVVASSRVGVAPYVIRDSNSQFLYMDSSKAKLYLAYGLPTVITRIAASASSIVQRDAGIGVDCNEEEIARALVTLLTDETLYARMHENALSLGAELLPERIFEVPVEMALGD